MNLNCLISVDKVKNERKGRCYLRKKWLSLSKKPLLRELSVETEKIDEEMKHRCKTSRFWMKINESKLSHQCRQS